MILPANSITKILKGQKTMWRTPITEPRWATRNNGTRYLTTPFTPTIGQTLPVKPGPRTDPTLHITITHARREPLGAITYTDARHEGHRTRDEFKIAWVRDHDRTWTNQNPHADNDDYLVRFDHRHAERMVWAITFTPNHDVDQYMARPTANSGDYTRNPRRAIDDIPTVDKAWTDKFAKQAAADNAARQAHHRAQTEKLPLYERLRRLEQAGDHIDRSSELRVIRKRIAALEAKTNPHPEDKAA